jgi:hypothetical protein
MLYLSITGFDADPNRVTDILGLQPTSVVREGQIATSGRPSKFNGWWFETNADRLVSGREHADALATILNAIRGRAAAFARLREELQPEAVSLYGGLYHRGDSQSGIWLDAADMLLLGECGIGWGLDLFGDKA